MSRRSQDESAKQQRTTPPQTLRAWQVAVLTGAPDYGRFLSHKPLGSKTRPPDRSSLPQKAPDCTCKRNPPIQTRHLALIAVDRGKILGAVDYGPGDCLPVRNLTSQTTAVIIPLRLPLSHSPTLLKQPASRYAIDQRAGTVILDTLLSQETVFLFTKRALSCSDNPECTHSRANHVSLGLERTNWQLGRLARISLED
jgi:hypothetical protein